MRAALRFLLLFAALCLAGCYELLEPVLERGEKAPIAGRFQCVDDFTGEKRTDSFDEKASGFFFRDYRYAASDGAELMFLRLDGDFYLVQTKDKDGSITASFAEFLSDKTIALFVAKLVTRGEAIEALARKYKVNISYAPSANLRLVGARGDILDFLRAHDRSMVTLTTHCARLP